MIIKPFQYPLIVGAVPGADPLVGQTQTITRTASITIPFNSKFVWLHTINATIKDAPGLPNENVKVVVYDSVKGPICNVPTLVENLAGAVFETFAAAPRSIRPFPLPESYVFNSGAVLTATYNIFLVVDGGSYKSVGIILCGYRVIKS